MSYEARIDDDFLLKPKNFKEMDEKTLKKKLKQTEKEAAKEISKDMKVIH